MLENVLADHWQIVIAILIGAFGYGRLFNKTKNHCTRIGKLEDSFQDGNGNPRLLTVIDHKAYCDTKQDIINVKLDNLIERSDKGEQDHVEIFHRLGVIEKSIIRLETINGGR